MVRRYKVTAAIVVVWIAAIGFLSFGAGGQHPIVAAAIRDKTGVGLFDTLAVLAAGGPKRVDTMPDAELYHANIGWAPRDSAALYLATWFPRIHIDVDTSAHGWTVRRWEERIELSNISMRGVATHEYGHWLEYNKPKLFARFQTAGIAMGTQGYAADDIAKWMQSEMFADAFATAVGRRLPDATIVPYRFSPAFTTEAQQRLLDEWVASRWDGVP
jgi:hypothetical protein